MNAAVGLGGNKSPHATVDFPPEALSFPPENCNEQSQTRDIVSHQPVRASAQRIGKGNRNQPISARTAWGFREDCMNSAEFSHDLLSESCKKAVTTRRLTLPEQFQVEFAFCWL